MKSGFVLLLAGLVLWAFSLWCIERAHWRWARASITGVALVLAVQIATLLGM